jgi:hypothetical protein
MTTIHPPLRRKDIYEQCHQLVHICMLFVESVDESVEPYESNNLFRGTLNDPQFVEFRFKKYLPDTVRFRRSDADIHEAVNVWRNTDNIRHEAREHTYGHISDWDTSKVTNMHGLFCRSPLFNCSFNCDLSAWDVSQVTDVWLG